jgi:ribosome-associated toxin RatA of RatAB toxin-antitoxin module
MPDQSSQSVLVAAQPAEILAVIGDFASYPEWAESVQVCEVLSRHRDGSADQVRFVIDSGLIQDDYVLAYVWDEGRLRVDWELVSGQLQRSQAGSYVLLPQGRQTQVTYTLAVDLTLPLIALLKRRAEKAIMDIALKSLKRRVEGGG